MAKWVQHFFNVETNCKHTNIKRSQYERLSCASCGFRTLLSILSIVFTWTYAMCYTVWSSELWWFVLVVVVQLHWYLSLWQVHLAPICMAFQCVYSFIRCCWFIMHSDHLSFTTKCKHEKTIARACGFSLFLCVVIDEIRSTEDGLEANISKLKFTSHHQFPFEYKWNSNISFTYHIWNTIFNSSEFFHFYLLFSIFSWRLDCHFTYILFFLLKLSISKWRIVLNFFSKFPLYREFYKKKPVTLSAVLIKILRGGAQKKIITKI